MNAVIKQEIVPKAEPSGAAITPMQMLEIAVNKGADLDQLQKLMDLNDRWQANEARKAFVTALSAFKAEPPTVTKNKRVSFGGRSGGGTEYDYATLPQVVDAIAPELSKYGLSHTWSTSQSETNISVTCSLTHIMGHSESVTLSAPADQSGSKNAIQAIGSTVSYLSRYSLLCITGLAVDDMDDDANNVNLVITAEQKQQLVDLQREVNADTAKFLAFFKIDNLDQLPQSCFTQAKIMLQKKRSVEQ